MTQSWWLFCRPSNLVSKPANILRQSIFHLLVYHQNVCHFLLNQEPRPRRPLARRRPPPPPRGGPTSQGLLFPHLSIFCSSFFFLFSIHGQCMFEAGLINQVHAPDLHCHPVASPEGAIRYSIMVAVLQTEQSRRQNSQQIEAAASCNHPYHIFSNLEFLLKGDMKVQRPAFSNDILSH